MTKGIIEHFSSELWLDKDHDIHDKRVIERSLAEYIRNNGLENKLPSGNIRLCRNIHPILGRRDWRWTRVYTKEIK